jgi:hypothetical protein
MEFTRIHRISLIGLGLTTVFAVAGFNTANAKGSAPKAEGEDQTAAVEPTNHNHGAPSKVRISHTPRRGAKADQIELATQVSHDLDGEANMGVSLSVYNAHWQPIDAPRRGKPTFGNRSKASNDSFSTPTGLSDGYYRIVVSAAAESGAELATETSEVLYRIRDGVAAVVSRKEYEQKSGMNDSIN